MRKMKTANDYAKNCLKPPKAFFEWCYYNMPTYKWANKQQTIIASERKHYFTEEKRLTKNSRLTFFDRRDHFHIKVGAVSDTTYDFRLVQLGNMLSMYAQRPTLYPNNWNDRLFTVSELRYLSIDSIYGDEIAFTYKYRQRIEYAQRINAPALAKQILEKKLDMRSITMNWLKRNKVFFRNSQRTYQAYQVKQALESLGTKYISGVEAFMGVDDISKIPEGVKPITFQNYLMKQKRTIGFYQDYLNMLNELSIPITPMTRLPKDLKMAHDKAVDTLNAMKRPDILEPISCIRDCFNRTFIVQP